MKKRNEKMFELKFNLKLIKLVFSCILMFCLKKNRWEETFSSFSIYISLSNIRINTTRTKLHVLIKSENFLLTLIYEL